MVAVAGEDLEIEIMRDKRKLKLEVQMPDDRSSMFVPNALPVRPAAAPAPAPAAAPKVVVEIEKT